MDLEKKVSSLSKEELIELVMDLVEGDEDTKRQVEYTLLTPNDEVKASKQLIRKYINENKRKGFIAWKNVHAALQGAQMVLDKGRVKLSQGEEETAVRFSIAVLSTVVDMLQYADDSGGEADYIIDESVTLLEDASSMVLLQADQRVQDSMFELILKEAMHKRYDGLGNWRYDLLDVCTIDSARTAARQKLEETLHNLWVQREAETTWSSNSDQQTIRELQIKILERNGEKERAQQLITENLEHEKFRVMAIEKEIDNENYETALEMAEEGEQNDSNYPSLVKKWKEYRMQVYEALGDIEKQKELLLELVYENEYEAYGKLRELHDEKEWKAVVEEIFQVLEEQSDDHLPHVYEYIATSENRSDKILKYCKQAPITIIELYTYLVDDYPEDVNELFTSHIKYEAENSAERTKYRSVSEKLELYREACGEENFQELLNEIKETYQRKPAFLSELEKVEA